MPTDRQRLEAAAEALGFEPDLDHIEAAEIEYRNYSLRDLEEKERELKAAFDAQGGRGVELADTLDTVRIVLAVRRLG